MKVPYTKPVVNRVELVLDQAVLAGCKGVQLYAGPVGGGDCEAAGVPGNQCLVISS